MQTLQERIVQAAVKSVLSNMGNDGSLPRPLLESKKGESYFSLGLVCVCVHVGPPTGPQRHFLKTPVCLPRSAVEGRPSGR